MLKHFSIEFYLVIIILYSYHLKSYNWIFYYHMNFSNSKASGLIIGILITYNQNVLVTLRIGISKKENHLI